MAHRVRRVEMGGLLKGLGAEGYGDKKEGWYLFFNWGNRGGKGATGRPPRTVHSRTGEDLDDVHLLVPAWEMKGGKDLSIWDIVTEVGRRLFGGIGIQRKT